MIEKTLHFVWVGDERRRPDKCIDTWRQLNPGYDVRIWGNAELDRTKWVNERHLIALIEARRLHGVADVMRYEILYRHGGVAIDADSICVRSLEDWLLEPEAFAAWENEEARPGLIAIGTLGTVRNNPFFAFAIEALRQKATVVDNLPWISTGPVFLTACAKARPGALTVYPSHYFYPEHFSGAVYRGSGPVFARQLWATSRNVYGRPDLQKPAEG